MTRERTIAAAFCLSFLASLALIVVYFVGGEPQLEGLFLGLALGGLGVGVVLWSTTFADGDEVVEERDALASSASDRAGVEDELRDEGVTRRTLLVRLALGAGAALAASLAIPALSLGPTPGQSLFRTGWTRGKRVVDADGNPLSPSDVIAGTVQTVFPAGEEGSADSQTLLVRVDPARLELAEGRDAWVAEGVIAYSKICTHAGCPVGLYRADAHELLCPCHQSTFDVLRGAEPNFGPADRPLPQLPLELDPDGYLVAGGDFSEPVGPGFWNLRGDT